MVRIKEYFEEIINDKDKEINALKYKIQNLDSEK
jgi:hypothetical protein